MDVIVEKDGKKVFVGKEDPQNPPVFVKNPHARYCQYCHKESGNEKEQCDFCGKLFDDAKMKCPVCGKYFDYLVGEDVADGRRGCEGCWKKPTERRDREPENSERVGEVFD